MGRAPFKYSRFRLGGFDMERRDYHKISVEPKEMGFVVEAYYALPKAEGERYARSENETLAFTKIEEVTDWVKWAWNETYSAEELEEILDTETQAAP